MWRRIRRYSRFEQALLGSSRHDAPPPKSLRRVARTLGISLPAAALELVTNTSAAGTAGGGAQLGASASPALGQAAVSSGSAVGTGAGGVAAGTLAAVPYAAQPVVAKVTTLVLLKHVGAGVLAGTVAMGGAQEVYHSALSPDPQQAPVALPTASAPPVTAAPIRSTWLIPAPPPLGAEPAELSAAQLAAEAPELGPVQAFGPASALPPAAAAPGVQVNADVVSRGGATMGPAPHLVAPHAGIANQAEPASPAPESGATAAFPTPPPSPSASAAPPKQQAPKVAGIEVERRLLARVRLCLKRADPVAALKVLRDYATRCPQGHLQGEANLLRVEALLRAGRRQPALDLARDEIGRVPTRERLQRIRTLFEARFQE